MHPSQEGPQAVIVRRNDERHSPLFVCGSYAEAYKWCHTAPRRINGHSELMDFDGHARVGIHIDTPFTRPGETR